ncbi:hypothetical protein I350_05604 [Cryptococcus amylolentus CBS 6273]|uniref:Mitochondrial adapter protein MCP1 transmembrane domain-containing protein n=1 Tax=Cryptococcus amylolentus CBS 6273 TaxID=1296118 RepID=A0A1E3JYL9_9TREE|nr:hypothetical protein I350_05604 [Cryptococcus amylolentus CBS 6273]
MASPRADPRGRGFLPSKASVLRVLTMTQNTSALVFTVFLVPHLASPVMATIGGLDGAEKTMMIARDLYLPLEPVLVYIPLAIHLTSSLTKRLILSTNPSLPLSIRLPRQMHQLLAYPLLLLLIPHILTHRLIPSSSAPPIRELSPSELGWEFVGHGLGDWLTWVGYLGLVGAGVWHAAVGSMKVAAWLRTLRRRPSTRTTQTKPTVSTGSAPAATNEQSKKRVVPRKRKLGLRGVIICFLGVVAFGLWRVKIDTGVVSPVMRRRYDAVFDRAPWAWASRLLLR